MSRKLYRVEVTVRALVLAGDEREAERQESTLLQDCGATEAWATAISEEEVRLILAGGHEYSGAHVWHTGDYYTETFYGECSPSTASPVLCAGSA